MPLGWKAQYLRYKEFFTRIINQYRKRPDMKMYLELFLSIMTVTVFATFALRPTILTITQLAKDIQTKEETVRIMDTKINNLARAENTFNQNIALSSLVKSSVPVQPSPEGFVRLIEGLAQKQTVRIQGVSIGEVTLVGEVQKSKKSEIQVLPENAEGLDFSISVSGVYSSILGFLSDLEKLRRPVKIDNLSINSSQTQTEKFLVLVISGRTPYFKGKIVK
jgi:Tfp pilus assembly protein PilO